MRPGQRTPYNRQKPPQPTSPSGKQPRGASRLEAKKPIPEPVFAPPPKKTPRTASGSGFSWKGLAKALCWLLLTPAVLLGGKELGTQLLPYINQPVTRVGVQGELPHIDPKLIQARMSSFVAQPFFQVDLVGIRQSLESIPWVARAEVRRVWPDRIIVKLVEHIPIARWGQNALLNNQGQAFTPADQGNYEYLPHLNGPQRAQQKVMHQYQLLSQMLRPMGFSISRLELHDRGSWFLSTTQGVEILLGRDQIVEKIRRFNTIYQKALEGQRDNIARIDLRHANGLAVAWHEPAPAPAAASSKH